MFNLRKERILIGFSFLLRSSLILASVLAFYDSRLLFSVGVLLTLLLTFLPNLFERSYEVYLPPELEVSIVFFVFASVFLGSLNKFYDHFWWWDNLLHLGSGLILGIAGFILVYVLNSERKDSFRLPPSFVALFAFTFAVALGGIWEIFEFLMNFTPFPMQKFGIDMIYDLIADTVGGFIVSLLGYLYLKGEDKVRFLEDLVEDFVEDNPRLF